MASLSIDKRVTQSVTYSRNKIQIISWYYDHRAKSKSHPIGVKEAFWMSLVIVVDYERWFFSIYLLFLDFECFIVINIHKIFDTSYICTKINVKNHFTNYVHY